MKNLEFFLVPHWADNGNGTNEEQKNGTCQFAGPAGGWPILPGCLATPIVPWAA